MVDSKTAVTAYIRDWLLRTNAAGETWTALAKRLGVTKQALFLVRDERNDVGHKLEENFARLHFKSSIDELRRAAHEQYQANKANIERYPNRVEAADVCRRSGMVSQEAIDSVLAEPGPAEDLPTFLWIKRMDDRDMELRRQAEVPKTSTGPRRRR